MRTGISRSSLTTLSLETAILPLEIAHHADDHHIAINGHSAKLLEIVEDCRKVAFVVDSNRNTYFRGVTIMSIDVRWVSNISNTLRRNP